ncbi:MAG: DNA replication/repair protein RecF [Bacilli bacterium]|nr:DNA replication/repair protein RecF [Bacilli bacterium]MDD4607561.1 DNA replication/repair protein RecF [Bacilli bacterium]
MILKSIKIENFRNYEALELLFDKKINIIYGNNAQGKTNILESIYVLGLTKSHRSFIDNNLIKNGFNRAKISGVVFNNRLNTNMEVTIENKTKHLKIDNSDIKKTSDYISKLNIIIFYPEDLELIKGSPSIRRKYFNLELSQLYSQYFKVLNDYKKILKIRNEYLKQMQKNIKVDQTYFDILTEYLIDKAIFIYKARDKFLLRINESCEKIYEKVSGSKGLNIKYSPYFNFESFETDYLKQFLKDKCLKMYNTEIKLGMTLVGPHRDDFIFYLKDKNLKEYGSQGQQRLAVIALKLAEVEVFKNYNKINPILLLDDVFSELDDTKKNKLLRYISKNTQTFITTTDLNNINQKTLSKAKIFKIKEGKVIKTKEVEKNG